MNCMCLYSYSLPVSQLSPEYPSHAVQEHEGVVPVIVPWRMGERDIQSHMIDIDIRIGSVSGQSEKQRDTHSMFGLPVHVMPPLRTPSAAFPSAAHASASMSELT